MHCLSRLGELYPRLDTLQRARAEKLDVLPKPSQCDLRRLPGILRERLSGTRPQAKIHAERWASSVETTVIPAPTIERSPGRAKRPETTSEPGLREKIRRARDATPANRREAPNMKSNGHDASAAKVNGHGPASPSSRAQETKAPLEMGRAASDDARDFPAAAAANPAAAGKERDACADVARSLEGETQCQSMPNGQAAGTGTSRAPSEENSRKDAKDTADTVDIPPGSEPLPADGLGFVDAIHEHVDLFLACARLVKSTDEKIAQRMMERLLEMSYGKGPATAGEEVPPIIFDAPRPIRD